MIVLFHGESSIVLFSAHKLGSLRSRWYKDVSGHQIILKMKQYCVFTPLSCSTSNCWGCSSESCVASDSRVGPQFCRKKNLTLEASDSQ